jgi:hypothetical protein
MRIPPLDGTTKFDDQLGPQGQHGALRTTTESFQNLAVNPPPAHANGSEHARNMNGSATEV